MMKRICLAIAIILLVHPLASGQGETVRLQVLENPELSDMVEQAMLAVSQEQALEPEQDTRGIAAMLGANLAIRLGSRALTEVYERSRKSRRHEWSAPVCRSYFYHSPSFSGPMDPRGLAFSGFQLDRVTMGEDGILASSFYLRCSLPEDQMEDFVVNHRFTLQLDSLAIDLSKVRARYTGKKTVTIQIDIDFSCTWMDQEGNIREQQLGEFRIVLPKLSYRPESPLVTFGGEQASHLISGACFFVPRSCGAIVAANKYVPCWGEGEFDLSVTVSENTGSLGKAAQYAYELASEVVLPSVSSAISSRTMMSGASVSRTER